jgi:hypothetical protein
MILMSVGQFIIISGMNTMTDYSRGVIIKGVNVFDMQYKLRES